MNLYGVTNTIQADLNSCIPCKTDDSTFLFFKVGDVIVGINDWKIQNIKQPEVAANIFRAAGNFVTINVDREARGSNWRPLDSF